MKSNIGNYLLHRERLNKKSKESGGYIGYINNEGCLEGWLNELAFAPVDFNITFEDWSAQRVKELQQELAVMSGEKTRCRRTGAVNNIDFHSLKKFYMENSDPYFIEAIERYLNEWVDIRNQISLNLARRQNKQYCRITDNAYMRIFDVLEFMTKIWY